MATEHTQEFRVDRTAELPRTVAVRRTKRMVVSVIGTTLIVAGLVLVILPGPFTIPLILLGLTVLSWEFRWARRALLTARRKAKEVSSRKRRTRAR
ncbi:MAG: PGPGW domain-containing protein [Actinomycetota bacterium]|nr:PGPGW domain-containing protein [Actinomycetota bacterium]